MAQMEIVRAVSRTEREAFVDLPWEIYEGDRNWVAPLKSRVHRLLDPSKHPFWERAERELFLARRGSDIVGRIVGIVDHNANRFHDQRLGSWGFFECRNDPEAAALLFCAVEDWLRGKGMEYVRGPMNPSPNYEIGLLVEGFEYPPVVMMTYNPPYYVDLVENDGFEKEKDLLALQADESHRWSGRVERLVNRQRERNHIHIRPLKMGALDREVEIMKALYEESWSDTWAFSPMTDGEAGELRGNLRWFADPDLVFFMYYGEEPAGVAMFLPDVNELLKQFNGKIGLVGLVKAVLYRRRIKGMRGVLFGVKEKYRKLGLSLAALDYFDRVARAKHYRHAEFSWVLEDNLAAHRLGREGGALVYKRYRVYKKPL